MAKDFIDEAGILISGASGIAGKVAKSVAKKIKKTPTLRQSVKKAIKRDLKDPLSDASLAARGVSQKKREANIKAQVLREERKR